jgi:lipid-binding SYLF domain-containing protein
MSPRARSSRWSRSVVALALGASTALPLAGCSRPAAKSASEASAGARQQAIVDESASAFERTRQNPRFAKMDSYLAEARGVMIFPKLVKASLIVGGEGGNGVLVARNSDGSWSAPAFYTLGAPSVGLQIGYQEATVVLFIMDDATLQRAIDSSLTLGAKSGVSVGNVGDHGKTQGELVSRNIYQVIDASGAFVGVSLDGYVTGPRSRHNQEYYGVSSTPRDILIGGAVHNHGASVLSRALTVREGKNQRLADGSR